MNRIATHLLFVSLILAVLSMTASTGCAASSPTPDKQETEPQNDQNEQDEKWHGPHRLKEDPAPTPPQPDTRSLDEKLESGLSLMKRECAYSDPSEAEGLPDDTRVVPAVAEPVEIYAIDRDEKYAWIRVEVPTDTAMERGALIESTGALAQFVEVSPGTTLIELRVPLAGAEGLEVGSKVLVSVCQWD